MDLVADAVERMQSVAARASMWGGSDGKWTPQLSLDVRVRAHVAAPWYPDGHVLFATHMPFPPGFPAAHHVAAGLPKSPLPATSTPSKG